jgi:hypothetical protein
MNTYRFLVMCLLCSACSSKELPFEDEGNPLLAESKQLNCANQRYERTIDSLWDVVSTRLDQVLPDTMPPGRRENMIQIRNAGLLKQFKIFYTTLDTVSLNLITRSGQIDSLIALQVMELKVQRETQEKRVLDFLMKVEHQNPQAALQWNKKFLQAAKEVCQ